MPKCRPGTEPLTFAFSHPDTISEDMNNFKLIATNGSTKYILTNSKIDPLDIPELERLLPSSAYTLQLLVQPNKEPLLLVGEQNPDKSLKRHHVWDFFGGKVHPNEAAFDAALRERIEEIGIIKEVAPYLDPVIYVVFDEDGKRCAKAFYFSVMPYELIKNPDFIMQCKKEIIQAADGRFELISLGSLDIHDFFKQILNHNGKIHEADLRALRVTLLENPQVELHGRNTWRKHVPELLGNVVIQELILQVIKNFVIKAQSSAPPRLRA